MAFPWMGRTRINGVALRASAKKDSRRPYEGVLADLPLGTRVTVMGRQGGWLNVTVTLNLRKLDGYVSQELVEPASSVPPGEYYQLVPHGNVLAIVKVDGKNSLEASKDLLTEDQLQSLLQQNSIPIVTASALSGFINSQTFPPAFDRHASLDFSRNPGTTRLSQSDWRGNLGEASAQYRGIIPRENLNALQPNHPTFDLRDPWGWRQRPLEQVKTSVRNPHARGDPYGTYLDGLADVLGLRSATYARARRSLYPNLAPAVGEALMRQTACVPVNNDHVEPLQAALRDPANYSKKPYWQLVGLLLDANPVTIDGVTYRTYQALEGLRQASGTSGAARQQAAAVLRALREQLASMVTGNGITTEHLVRLQNFRQQIALANPQMSEAQIRSWVFPEMLLVERYGGGARGNMVAAGSGGRRGAVGGTVVSLLVETGHLMYTRPPDMGHRLIRTGVAGATSGFAGGATEAFAAGSMGSAMAFQLTQRGASSWAAAGMGRGLGGAVGGGVAAPVFSMAMMALDDQEHSGTDYAATGTRAAVSGALSGALAAGVVGAIWGTEVPILGNIVGFIIGFAGYYAVDALGGDWVEMKVRHALEE